MIKFLLALMPLDTDQVTVPPVRISLSSTTVERALEEFDKLCLQPRFDPQKMAAAVAASSLKYVADPDFDRGIYRQRRWRAPEAMVTLTYLDGIAAADGLPQCDVNMVSEKPHTKAMLRDLVLPLLSPYATSKPIFPNGEEGAIEWGVPDSDNTYRVDIAPFERNGSPTNSSHLGITVYTPEGMRSVHPPHPENEKAGGAK